MPGTININTTRSILMLLGIVLHAADIHTMGGNWLVADSARHIGFDWTVAFIHSFRVPGFFMLSGLLLSVSVHNHRLSHVLERQLLRLGLPLLSAWLLFNTPQQWLLEWRGLLPLLAWQFPPIYHLWFLRDLLLMNLLLLAALVVMRRQNLRLNGLLAGMDRLHWLSISLLGAALGYALLLVLRATGLAYQPLVAGLTLYGLGLHAPLFLAGYWMHKHPQQLKSWLATPLWLLPLAAALAHVCAAASRTAGSAPLRELALAAYLLGTWCATGAVVGALGRMASTDNPLTRRLSRGSYTVFLIHHLIVVALGLLLLPLPLPALLKFAINISLTLILSLAFHELVVQRHALSMLLFNGRRRPIAQANPGPGA